MITHLTKGTDWMHFYYDAQSRPAMLNFNGEIYNYVHNLQGDIIGIVDNTGALVVEYAYDAWGKPTKVWSEDNEMLTADLITAYATLAALNPFRYRGYVWDQETGLYYLRSRYYVVVWGRFINCDAYIYISNWIGDLNVFTYCGKSPTMLKDPNGDRPLIAACLNTETKEERAMSFALMKANRDKQAKKVITVEGPIYIRKPEGFEDVTYVVEKVTLIPYECFKGYFTTGFIDSLADSTSFWEYVLEATAAKLGDKVAALGLAPPSVISAKLFPVTGFFIYAQWQESVSYQAKFKAEIDNAESSKTGIALVEYTSYRISELGTYGGTPLRTVVGWDNGLTLLDYANQ